MAYSGALVCLKLLFISTDVTKQYTTPFQAYHLLNIAFFQEGNRILYIRSDAFRLLQSFLAVSVLKKFSV